MRVRTEREYVSRICIKNMHQEYVSTTNDRQKEKEKFVLGLT